MKKALLEQILLPKKTLKAASCVSKKKLQQKPKEQLIANLSEHLPHPALDFVATQIPKGKKHHDH